MKNMTIVKPFQSFNYVFITINDVIKDSLINFRSCYLLRKK